LKDLFYANITNNNSPLKNGSVQFRIPALMDGILSDDDLPWALPWNIDGGSADSGSSDIPEVGDLIWVYFEDFLKKKAFYVAGINLKNFGPHNLFEENVKSEITGWTSSYPDVKFKYLKNGICIASSSNESSPEFAIYHPEGAYIFIDKNGAINIKGKTGTLEFSILGETLKTWLNNLITQIKTGVAPSGGGIVTYATIDAFALTLSTILSQTIKNN
jgi:hypothetical protein